MSLVFHRSPSYAWVLLVSILSFTSIVAANTNIHYDPPIPLYFSSCTPTQITSLTSEINLIRKLSTSISENWQNHNHSTHIRDAYNYFYTAGGSEPLYSYASSEVRRGLRRALERMGKIQVLGTEKLSQSLVGGERKERKRSEGLRIICKPRREADCGNSMGQGVEAFVGNGPTVRVGPEVEALAARPTGNAMQNMKNEKPQNPPQAGTRPRQTKQPKPKRKEDLQKGKWLLTNGNDVQLCPLFWENISLDVPNPWEALREIPVGDFVDYRLLTLMHELTHTHILTGDLYLSPSHEQQLSLGLLDHGYGLRQPRSTENPDPSSLPRTYGERVVRKYDDNGKAVEREVKEVPYVTELSSNEAWANGDTLVYFVFVAWQEECWSEHSHGWEGRRRRKTRHQRLREIGAMYTNRVERQIAIRHTGGHPVGSCARKCPPGKDPVLEVLPGSERGRSGLKRVWCKPRPRGGIGGGRQIHKEHANVILSKKKLPQIP